MALLRKMTCNLRHPMSLRHPVHPCPDDSWVLSRSFSLALSHADIHTHTELLSLAVTLVHSFGHALFLRPSRATYPSPSGSILRTHKIINRI